jgi:hypothetical protein
VCKQIQYEYLLEQSFYIIQNKNIIFIKWNLSPCLYFETVDVCSLFNRWRKPANSPKFEPLSFATSINWIAVEKQIKKIILSMFVCLLRPNIKNYKFFVEIFDERRSFQIFNTETWGNTVGFWDPFQTPPIQNWKVKSSPFSFVHWILTCIRPFLQLKIDWMYVHSGF